MSRNTGASQPVSHCTNGVRSMQQVSIGRQALRKKSGPEITFHLAVVLMDRLCGLVVRVLGYRSGGPGLIPGTTRKKR
jgi:hypothetical protein